MLFNYNDVVVHHHLGLGDHILCNGLVRSLLGDRSIFKRAFVFAKHKNTNAVARMFRDDPSIMIVPIPPEVTSISSAGEALYANHFCASNSVIHFLRVGYGFIEHCHAQAGLKHFDEALYMMAGVPHENRWTKFHFARDREHEARVLKKMNPSGAPFVFVHDDPSRDFVIRDLQIPAEWTVLKNDPSESIFDYGLVLEKAEQVHCMESSFRCLIDHLDGIDDQKLYLHARVRNHDTLSTPAMRRTWNTVSP